MNNKVPPLRGNLLSPFGRGDEDDQLSEIELPPPGSASTREVVLPIHAGEENTVKVGG